MTIENILLIACLLLLIQIFIPIIIDLVFTQKIKIVYLFTSRDNNIENSIYFNRGKRALSNLLETLPIFISLALLSIFLEIDNAHLALLWLVFRATYFPIYILGIKYARTLLWLGALACLILMGIKFI
ncbi:MAG: MAPEG family protein [Proteobacteria bacterium]|nr:MAPEG family protein [Pseudomonadota bacterium]MDA1134930.1 MAPEG family protein [Pseudomonadota bacterium]